MPLVNVEVTSDDVWLAKRSDTWFNPIASALWRATGQKWEVDTWQCTAIEPSPRRVVLLPVEASNRLKHWNHIGIMAPFTFQIHIPEVAAHAKA